MKNNNRNGYIALISAIILSVLLIVVSSTLSLTGFFSRFDVLNSEYKKKSLGFAESCVDLALLKLANPSNDAYYQGLAATVPCAIISVSTSAPYIIKTQGVYQNSYSNIQVTTDSNFSITSWQELSNF